MKTKTFLIEVIQHQDSKRTYVVREFAAPNVLPVVKCVTSDVTELASFFDSGEIFGVIGASDIFASKEKD